MKLVYTVKRGRVAGQVMTPHKHKDGMYVASKTRFEEDYIREPTIERLVPHIERGMSIRMSVLGTAASLISPASIEIQR